MRWCFHGCSSVSTSVVAAHIYREDSPGVTASRNQLGLFLSKRIRHGLIIKINDKRRPRTYEALGLISADYSRARRAPTPTAASGPARRASACVSLFLLSSLARAYRATHLINRLLSTSNIKVRRKSHPACMNEALRFIRNYPWPSPIISNVINSSRICYWLGW
jgi:hypothetical protein